MASSKRVITLPAETSWLQKEHNSPVVHGTLCLSRNTAVASYALPHTSSAPLPLYLIAVKTDRPNSKALTERKVRQGQKKSLLEAKLFTEEQLCSSTPEGHSLKKEAWEEEQEGGGRGGGRILKNEL